MTNPHHSSLRVILLAALALFFSFAAPMARSRIPIPPEIGEVRELADKAPVVFRGQVGGLAVLGLSGDDGALSGTAMFLVDRQYKGRVPAEVNIHFAYSPMQAANGHDCIKFSPGSYWLVFATRSSGGIQLADDCQGALPVSARLGPEVHDFFWAPQMEADFLAGLHDPDHTQRLVSLQRLAALRMPSSLAALHRAIEGPDQTEVKWAIYGAVRIGDVAVLRRVKVLLEPQFEMGTAESYIAVALKDITSPAAAEELVSILDTSRNSLARYAAIAALAENLRDPHTIPVFAEHLSDADAGVRYQAYVGIANITHAQACLGAAGKTEEDRVNDCKAWWEKTGRLQTWN